MNKFWQLVNFDFDKKSTPTFTARILKFISFFYILVSLISIHHFYAIKPILKPGLNLDLYIWSLEWLSISNAGPTALVLGILNIILPIICFFKIHLRYLRILCFLSIYFFWGIVFKANNYIFHSFHTLILVLFSFCLLPNNLPNYINEKLTRIKIVKTLWLSTALIMITYTCAGISKLLGALYDISEQKISILNTDIFSLTMAQYWEQMAKNQLFSSTLIFYDYLTYSGYIFIIALELSALYMCFKVRYLRFIAFFIIIFHWLTAQTMGIEFPTAIWVMAYIVFGSPFNKELDISKHLD